MLARLRPPAARITLALLGLGVAAGGLESVAHAGPPGVGAKGSVTHFAVSGFAVGGAGKLQISGVGACRVRADIMDMSRPQPTKDPVFSKLYEPASLPLTIDNLGPFPAGSYRAYLIGYDDKTCLVQGPDKKAGGWYIDFKIGGPILSRHGTPSGGGSNAGTGGATPAAGGAIPTGGKAPANGALSALSVPGGSFAEDDTQKLLVSGKGGCGFDLAISNKSYGGTYEKTENVLPMKLQPSATLYNGTHFGTLAQGSYHATVTGKNGCTGTAAIDFNVTAKTSTKKVPGKPVVSFDQQPKSGGTFTRSKDSSIWFKVTLPSSIKDEPNAGCCDVEFDFQNEFGGWEPLPNSPFTDSGFGAAIKQSAGVNNKSISGFTNGTVWRVKVRGYKYKTELEWSDWVEFRVDQN